MRVSRKNFIIQTFSYLTAPYFIRNLRANSQKTALVLGGGLSGAYAAFRLNELGYKVTIVEANSKLGGRISTVQKNFLGQDVFLEFGAEYISQSHTRVLELAKNLQIQVETSNFSLGLLEKRLSSFDNPYFLSNQSLKILKKLLSALPKFSQEQLRGLDQINLYNYLKYQGFSTIDLESFNLFCLYYYGESIQYLSTQKTLFDILKFSSFFYKFKFGTETLIQNLIQQKKIKFNFLDPVVKVEQSSKKITVSLKSGKTLQSDVCFCSLPINQIIKIEWNPLLNRNKRLAFLKLRYSKIARSYFLTDKPFSKLDVAFLYNSYLNFIQGKLLIKEKYRLLNVEYYNQIATSNQKMNALEKEKMVKFLIKKFQLSEEDFNVLKSIHSSDLYSDYIPMGKSIFTTNTFQAQDILRKSENRIFFIGEHLGENTGTMEGAIESVDIALKNL